MTTEKTSRLRELSEEFQVLEKKLKLGGGVEKIEKIHSQGKLTARERVDLLFDENEYQQEIGLLVAYDEYKGQAPAAAVVTSVGKINGRECVVIGVPPTRPYPTFWASRTWIRMRRSIPRLFAGERR